MPHNTTLPLQTEPKTTVLTKSVQTGITAGFDSANRDLRPPCFVVDQLAFFDRLLRHTVQPLPASRIGRLRAIPGNVRAGANSVCREATATNFYNAIQIQLCLCIGPFRGRPARLQSADDGDRHGRVCWDDGNRLVDKLGRVRCPAMKPSRIRMVSHRPRTMLALMRCSGTGNQSSRQA
jgi:hypothetical protein